MKRVYFGDRARKAVFFALVMISFAAIWIYNCLTPLMSDDLLFRPSDYHSVLDIFRLEYEQYMTWNGRSVLQIILKIFSLMPKWVFNLCNSLCFVILSLLIYANVSGGKKYDGFLYVLIHLLLWNFSVEFDQTVLWMGGACNYLWGIVILLGFLTCFRCFLEWEPRPGRGSWRKGKPESGLPSGTGIVRKGGQRGAAGISVFLFFFGVLAGWGNENTSGGGILIALLYTFFFYMERKKIHPWTAAGIAGMAVGFLFLLLAPGNKARGALMLLDESYSGIMAYVSRGLKINKAVNRYMMVYIAVICLLCVYFFYKRRKLAELKDTFIFSLAGLATSYVLILTPEPMPRAYFGANIFFAVACIRLICMIPREEVLLYSLKTGGIAAAAIWMFFSYTENGANLARIMREVNEREAYILEQTGMGNTELILPMLRPEFQTEYSFMYENDISEEKSFWINEVFCLKYGLDRIEAIPREEWDD